MLENETQIIEKIYKVNKLEGNSRFTPNKSNKMKNVIVDIHVNDLLSAKVKKQIAIGLQLLIIAGHIAFFILRMIHI